eukprot:1271916-Pyramimonas_sp.AAC.1
MNYLAVLWDLLQFYEHVPYSLLLQCADQCDYPMASLLVSISSYKWPRYLLYDGLLMPGVYPRRGIVVGSTPATFEAKLALKPIVEEYSATLPQDALVPLHIDDLTHHARGGGFACPGQGIGGQTQFTRTQNCE